MLQESSLARQTRRRLSSLEATQAGRRVLARLSVSSISRMCNPCRSKRGQFATVGRVVSPRKHKNTSDSGLHVGFGCENLRRRNVLSQQSRMGWDGLPIAVVGNLPTTADSACFGSERQQRSPHCRGAERCQEDTESSAGQRTIRGEGRWRLRSPNPSEHSRISEG